jgi:hypothetical protein
MKNTILKIRNSFAIILLIVVSISLQSCFNNYDLTAPETCFDGKQNGIEEGVDCGGDCRPCPSCDDGIQNGNETGVDCGGPDCPECPETCDDGILNNGEEEIDCGGPNCDPCIKGSVVSYYEFLALGFEYFHTFEAEDTYVTLDPNDPGNDVTTQGADLPMMTFGVTDPADDSRYAGRYNRPEGNISDGFSDFKFRINEGSNYPIEEWKTVGLSVYTPAGTIGGNVTPTVEIIFIARGDGNNGGNPNFWEHWTILNGVLEKTDEWEKFTFDASGVYESMTNFGVVYDQIAIRIGGSGHTEPATFFVKDFVVLEADVVASASFADDQGRNLCLTCDEGNDVTTQGADLPMMTFGVTVPGQGASLAGRYNRPEGNISDGFSDFKFGVNEGDPYVFDSTAEFRLEVFTPAGTIDGNVTPTVEIIFLARTDPNNGGNPNFWEHWTIKNAVITKTDEWETFVFDGSDIQASMEAFGVQYDQIAIRIGGSGHTEPATFYVRNFTWTNSLD